MKKSITALLFLMAFLTYESHGQGPTNFEITINGKTYEISLGHEYELKLESGEMIKFRLDKKAIVTYKDEFVSFQHKSDLTISSTDLGDGIFQTMTNTASGTLILIQEYSALNPISLIDLMLQELTKEQINYGYRMQEEAYSRTLKDGKTLKGKRATLTYKDEEIHWAILAYGKKDRGILVITSIDKENMAKEKDIIDLMWRTLKIGF